MNSLDMPEAPESEFAKRHGHEYRPLQRVPLPKQPTTCANSNGPCRDDSQGDEYGQTSHAYEVCGNLELTTQEQEENSIDAAKEEIKFIKQQDVSSTRNALRLAQLAQETGRDTLARLGGQGERIHKYAKTWQWSQLLRSCVLTPKQH
jgi:hypothetical protein